MHFFSKKEKHPTKKASAQPEMSRWYTSPGSENWFVDESCGVRTLVVNRHGGIENFPGIVREEFWLKEVVERDLQPKVRYASYFERRAGKIIFLWQIHPDGRYWADEDGFGWEDDEEVTLYAFLDHRGRFEAPFRIYAVGSRRYPTDETTTDSMGK